MIIVDSFIGLADLFHNFVLEDFVEDESCLIGQFHLIERDGISLFGREIIGLARARQCS